MSQRTDDLLIMLGEELWNFFSKLSFEEQKEHILKSEIATSSQLKKFKKQKELYHFLSYHDSIKTFEAYLENKLNTQKIKKRKRKEQGDYLFQSPSCDAEKITDQRLWKALAKAQQRAKTELISLSDIGRALGNWDQKAYLATKFKESNISGNEYIALCIEKLESLENQILFEKVNWTKERPFTGTGGRLKEKPPAIKLTNLGNFQLEEFKDLPVPKKKAKRKEESQKLENISDPIQKALQTVNVLQESLSEIQTQYLQTSETLKEEHKKFLEKLKFDLLDSNQAPSYSQYQPILTALNDEEKSLFLPELHIPIFPEKILIEGYLFLDEILKVNKQIQIQNIFSLVPELNVSEQKDLWIIESMKDSCGYQRKTKDERKFLKASNPIYIEKETQIDSNQYLGCSKEKKVRIEGLALKKEILNSLLQNLPFLNEKSDILASANPIPGLNIPFGYFSTDIWTCIHSEYEFFPFWNINLSGDPILWIFVEDDLIKINSKMLNEEIKKSWQNFKLVLPPKWLNTSQLKWRWAIQQPGDLILGTVGSIHQVFPLGSSYRIAGNYLSAWPHQMNQFLHFQNVNFGLFEKKNYGEEKLIGMNTFFWNYIDSLTKKIPTMKLATYLILKEEIEKKYNQYSVAFEYLETCKEKINEKISFFQTNEQKTTTIYLCLTCHHDIVTFEINGNCFECFKKQDTASENIIIIEELNWFKEKKEHFSSLEKIKIVA